MTQMLPSLTGQGCGAEKGLPSPGQSLPTYHFIIDFMEMDLTDFLHNVFVLKSDKAKPYRKRRNREEE